MPKFVPSGYLSIDEALDRLGRELFPSEWTGAEHKARRGLISEDQWLRIKDLPPARVVMRPVPGERAVGHLPGPLRLGCLRRPTILPALRTKRSTRRASGMHPRAVGFAFRLSGEISKQLFWIHLPGHCIERPHRCGAGTMPIG